MVCGWPGLFWVWGLAEPVQFVGGLEQLLLLAPRLRGRVGLLGPACPPKSSTRLGRGVGRKTLRNSWPGLRCGQARENNVAAAERRKARPYILL